VWVYWSAFVIVVSFALGGSVVWALATFPIGESVAVSALLIFATVSIVLLVRSQFPAKDPIEQKPARNEQQWQAAQNQPASISADFAALIHAIRYEGKANRREERREDRGKAFREKITIGLIAATLTAVGWQVREMVRVYEPISEQAKASSQAASATLSAQRAWVGPLTVTVPSIQKDKGIVGTIPYQNSGREPAANFYPYFTAKVYSVEDWNGGEASKDISTTATNASKLPGCQMVCR
jgi:hypothetical protein